MFRAARQIVATTIVALFVAVAPVMAADVTPPADSQRIDALTKAIAGGDVNATSSFWAEVEKTGSPIIESAPDSADDMIVTFVARATPGVDLSATPGVFFFGAKPPIAAMAPVMGTDVFFKSYRVSKTARSAYGVLWPRGRTPDPAAVMVVPQPNATWELLPDALAHTSTSITRLGAKSTPYDWFEGTAAPQEPYLAARPNVPHGTVATWDFASKTFGDTRKVSIYTPPGYDAKKSGGYGLVLVFDRDEYLSVVPTPTLLDNLIVDRKIPPVVVVLVGSAGPETRMRDLIPNDEFQTFLRSELVPWVRARRNLSHDPRRNAVAGSSLGGLTALYTGLKASDLFGAVVSQSASLWWAPDVWPEGEDVPLSVDANRMAELFAQSPKLPLTIWMDVGRWERQMMVTPNRELRTVLNAKGYAVTYQEQESGHDYVTWRRTLAEGLIATLGR